MTDALEIACRLLGGFYLFSGAAMMRSATVDHMLDQALAGLTLQPVPLRDTVQKWLLATGALALGMGGAALMVLSLWALPLLVYGAFNQAAYVVAIVTGPDATDEHNQLGTKNILAWLLYGGTIALAVGSALSGVLYPWSDPWALFIPLAGSAILFGIGRHLLWRAPRAGHRPIDAGPEPDPLHPPRAVRLGCSWGNGPLSDADTGAWVDYSLFVPTDLADRIFRWGDVYYGGDDERLKEFWAQFPDAAAEAAHRVEGEAIAAELRAIFGNVNVSGPFYTAEVRYGTPPPL